MKIRSNSLDFIYILHYFVDFSPYVEVGVDLPVGYEPQTLTGGTGLGKQAEFDRRKKKK